MKMSVFLNIQNNVPNMKMSVFFLYSNSVFEYRIKKMRSGYTNC